MPNATKQRAAKSESPGQLTNVISATVISLDQIVDAPWKGSDPRADPKPDSVRELAQTIEQVGLLHPLVVMPTPEHPDKYMLLAGKRRRAALRLLGHKSASVTLITFPEGTEPLEIAQKVALIENNQRAALDPVKESTLVCALLARENHTLESVAAELGMSISTVQRRARLANLAPAVHAARKSGRALESWPVAWLEDLSLLEPAEQVALVEAQEDQRGFNVIRSHGVLRELVRARLQALSNAPWPLDDAELDPLAGPCTKCPKHSAAAPGLFEENGTVELKAARCLDSLCFKNKLARWRDGEIARAKEKHGAELVLLRGPDLDNRPFKTRNEPDYQWRERNDAMDIEGEVFDEFEQDGKPKKKGKQPAPELAPAHEYVPAKKGDKGAVPSLVAEGAGLGKVQWVKPRGKGTKGESINRDVDRAPAKPKTMKEKVAALEKRRHRHVLMALQDTLERWLKETRQIPKEVWNSLGEAQWLVDLATCFGVARDTSMVLNRKHGLSPKDAGEVLQDGAWKTNGNLDVFLRTIRSFIDQRLHGLRYVDNLTEMFEWGRVLFCQGMGLEDDWNAMVAFAKDEIPTPRSWGEDAAAERKAKGATSKKAKAAVDDLERRLSKTKKKRARGKMAAANDVEEDD